MEKVNWLDLSVELHNRYERTGFEYDKLKEKIRNCLRNEQNLDALNEQQSVFNKFAEHYFADSCEILTLATEQMGLEIFKKDWTNLNGADHSNEAVIYITSALPFQPLGFNLSFRFLTETNPITFRQEFTLTVQGYKSEDSCLNSSEKYKLTKKLHNLRSLKDWEKLGFTREYLHCEDDVQRLQSIETEFYKAIKDLIANSVLYSQADFQTMK